MYVYITKDLFNKRNKMASKCRHKLKYARARYDAND